MRHEPVLLNEVLDFLNLKPGDVVLDATLGSGGHSEAILEKIKPNGLLIGIDQDTEALKRASDYLSKFGSKIILRQSNFRHLDGVLDDLKVSNVDAVLLDIGVSREQIMTGERGFSFRLAGPLDMRMNPEVGQPASEFIQRLPEKELARIFHEYGEERRSRRFARLIIDARRATPFRTTLDLAQFIEERVPAKVRHGRIHPATRIFQALRIAVNDELGALREALEKGIGRLKPNGRIAVISFHSLEDRIVKHTFREKEKDGQLRILTKKPVVPGEEEVGRNPYSRSAKLRAAVKQA